MIWLLLIAYLVQLDKLFAHGKYALKAVKHNGVHEKANMSTSVFGVRFHKHM